MTHAFSSTGIEITDALTAALERDGIHTPTAVQAAAIPPVLAGKDVVIQSGTGTGKTLAYLLPLLERARKEASFRVVVMGPSPELGVQIFRVAEAYKAPTVHIASLVGSGNIERQKEKLKKEPQVLIGTPGRVLEMMLAGKLQPRTIGALVLDEVEQILTEQNDAELRAVCSRPEVRPQLILASATVAARAEGFIRDCMTEGAVRLQLRDATLKEAIAHHYVVFQGKRREGAVGRLVEKLDVHAALVFVHNRYNVAKLFHALRDSGITCATLSAERTRQQRRQALDAFRKGEARVLVATDAVARGLDVPGLGCVVHYELPNDRHTYRHAAGRTGRAGGAGVSIIMITREELPYVERLSRDLGIEITLLPEGRLDRAPRRG